MYKSVIVKGKAGIRATCLLHSVDLAGTLMVTFEVESAKWDMHCLTSVSIEVIEDNLFEVVRVVDRVMYQN